MPMLGTRASMSVRGFGFGGISTSEMRLVASSITAANIGATTIALPTSPNTPQAGDFCFVFASANTSDPLIGTGGGIVGWSADGSDSDIGYFGYGKRLTSGDISTNQIKFSSTTNYQTFIFVLRGSSATSVVAKTPDSFPDDTIANTFTGFTKGAGAKQVVLFNIGFDQATLTSPALPSSNVATLSGSNYSPRARWGDSALYTSLAVLSYTISPATGVAMASHRFELD